MKSKSVTITSKPVKLGNGVTRYKFVVNGKSESLRTWATARGAVKAGRREYRLD
jgi:hypothetical protein